MRKKTKTAKRLPPLFSYHKGNTVIHRMPALLKLFLVGMICMRVFSKDIYGGLFSGIVNKPYVLCIRTAFYSFLMIISFFLSKISISSLKRLLFIPVMGIFITAARIMPSSAEELLNYSIDKYELLDCILYTAGLFISTASSLVMFETTSRLSIYNAFDILEEGISKVIPPVKKIHAAQIFSITISFIPEILSTWNKISMAADARDTYSKDCNKLFKTLRIFFVKFYALFYNMLQYAEETRKAASNRM